MSKFPSICGVDYDSSLPIVNSAHFEGLFEDESDEKSRDLVDLTFYFLTLPRAVYLSREDTDH